MKQTRCSAVASIMTVDGLQAMPQNYYLTWSRTPDRGNILSQRNNTRLYGPLLVWVDHFMIVLLSITCYLEVRKALHLLLQFSQSAMASISTTDVSAPRNQLKFWCDISCASQCRLARAVWGAHSPAGVPQNRDISPCISSSPLLSY